MVFTAVKYSGSCLNQWGWIERTFMLTAGKLSRCFQGFLQLLPHRKNTELVSVLIAACPFTPRQSLRSLMRHQGSEITPPIDVLFDKKHGVTHMFERFTTMFFSLSFMSVQPTWPLLWAMRGHQKEIILILNCQVTLAINRVLSLVCI